MNESDLTPEIKMVQRIFGGRIVEEGQEVNETPEVSEKMYRCTNALPGCGQAKPLNAFYREIKELCSECSLKLARLHNTGLEYVPLVFSCYEITRQFNREAKFLLNTDQEKYKAGFKKLVTDNGIERGRNHFIKQMISGSRDKPLDIAYFQDLRDRYRKWFFTEFGIEPALYSNLPKNSLLDTSVETTSGL